MPPPPPPPPAFHVFGDSFTFPFTLVDRPNLRVTKFSGASAKGLGNPDNENRRAIERAVARNRPACALFVFGTVDLQFGYYHRLWEKGERTDFAAIARGYVAALRDLPVAHKCVLGPFPTTVPDHQVVRQLIYYGSLSERTAAALSPRRVADATRFATRDARRRLFTAALRTECAAAGIGFVDVAPLLTGRDGRLLKRYKDPSEFTVHILFEPALPALVREVTAAMDHACRLPRKYKVDLEKSVREYVRRKRKLLARLP